MKKAYEAFWIFTLSLWMLTPSQALDFDIYPTVKENSNLRAPLAATVRFVTDEPVKASLQVQSIEGTFEVHFPYEDTLSRTLPVLGLIPGGFYRLKLTITNKKNEALEVKDLSYIAPSLPSTVGAFPVFEVLKSQVDEQEPGFTFLSIRRGVVGRSQLLSPSRKSFSDDWGLIVALNHKGQVVWYYQADHTVAGIDRLQNGNMIFHLLDFRMQEVDMLGNIVNEWYAENRPQGKPVNPDAIPIKHAQTLHHQPLESPTGTFYSFSGNARVIDNYYITEWDKNAPRKTQKVMGDDVIEFDREGNQVWRWRSWDYLDPFRIGYDLTTFFWPNRGFPGHLDWTHGNGLTYDAKDDSVIINLRHQDALFKIDKKTGEIVWILGEPTDWPKHLQGKLLRPVGSPFKWLMHAHNPRLTKDGNILLFDNQKFGARPFNPIVPPDKTYSRAVEYQVDEEAMTVRQVWSSQGYESDQHCNSFDMGDAHYLEETGNILVVNSMCSYREPNIGFYQGDFTKKHFNEIYQWSRITEFSGRERRKAVFDVRVKDPLELVTWITYGGFHTPDLYLDMASDK